MSLKLFATNTTAKILCVLFAVMLWFNVATNEMYHYKVNIPIKYIDPSSGYMLASTPPQEIQVYLSGTGKHLLYFILRSFMDPDASYISVNLAGYPKGRHRISLEKENILLPTEDGVTVESILYNAFFPVVVDKQIRQTIRVDVDSLPPVDAEEGYILTGEPTADPEYVIAEGPEDTIAPLQSIRVASLAVTTLSPSDTLVTGTLKSPGEFVTLNQQNVQIGFTIEPVRTKLFQSIPVSFRDFPRRFRDVLVPDTLSVFIQGPESIVSQSRKEDISVTVQYNKYKTMVDDGDSTIVPDIRYPDGLTNVKTNPVFLRLTDNNSGS